MKTAVAQHMHRFLTASAVALLLALKPSAAQEPVSPDADFTVREIAQRLHKAAPGERLE
ncbi:MAG: hypothetical protein K0U34_00180 [Alphaproteobacteria bacterium]|nr:hypothetical protein [Alphaproteobacteria bacterium]